MQGLKEYSKDLAVGLLSAMYEDDADFTNTFRALGRVTAQAAEDDVDGVPAPLLQVLPLPLLLLLRLWLCEMRCDCCRTHLPLGAR